MSRTMIRGAVKLLTSDAFQNLESDVIVVNVNQIAYIEPVMKEGKQFTEIGINGRRLLVQGQFHDIIASIKSISFKNDIDNSWLVLRKAF